MSMMRSEHELQTHYPKQIRILKADVKINGLCFPLLNIKGGLHRGLHSLYKQLEQNHLIAPRGRCLVGDAISGRRVTQPRLSGSNVRHFTDR